MLGLFQEKHVRYFRSETRQRGAKVGIKAARALVAAAIATVPEGQGNHGGRIGRNLREDAVFFWAAWTAAIVNRAYGRPSGLLAIDPDLTPAVAQEIEELLVRHGELSAP